MPPNLNIYVVSPLRNRETIERFLAAYVDRAETEDRGNEELSMVALDSSGQPLSGDDWDWEPSKSLTHIVDRGLEFPQRAFSVYLRTLDASFAGAILAFDVDNQVIFGVSLNDEGARTENLERAQTLLHEMAQALGATHGFIGVEEPPPLRGTRRHPTILVHSWPSPD
jgi:hypothetical protein